MKIRNQHGFTLIEALVVLSMMAILVSLAVPYFADWRKNSQFKAGARDLASAFQEAKSVAISRNIQARVVIDPSANTYQIELGSLPNNSTWPGSLLKSNTLSSQVGMSTTNACNTATLTSIIFNPNGTTGQSGIFCICIMDGTTPKYRVGIASATSGHVEIKINPDTI